MEYVRGKSLDALIPRQGMRLGEVLRIAIPVADALAAAHAQRHRPSRSEARQRDGRQRRRREGPRLRAGEADGHRVGAGRANADGRGGRRPQRARRRSRARPRTCRPSRPAAERWIRAATSSASATMLYEMATGARPFGGTTVADTLAAVIRAQPKPPTAAVPGLPRELERLILRCLRKEPDRRYQTIRRRQPRAAGDQGGVRLGTLVGAHSRSRSAPASRGRGHGGGGGARHHRCGRLAAPVSGRASTASHARRAAHESQWRRDLAAAVSRWRTGGVFVGQRERARGYRRVRPLRHLSEAGRRI